MAKGFARRGKYGVADGGTQNAALARGGKGCGADRRDDEGK